MNTSFGNRALYAVRPGLIDGILLVDKPPGVTSHDVVDRVRRHFKIDKCGHAGTLDPQATGLLILMLGRATKLANDLMSGDKTYEGTMRLGVMTDTQDGDGRVVREADPGRVTREALFEAIGVFTGDLMQTPPMVSAAKKDGVPLYKLARKGQTVERKPKLIHVYEFSLLDFALPRAAFRLRCSKGVYVRTLCADIGDRLGCGAFLESLRRTQSGEFRVAEAVTTAQLFALGRDQLLEKVIPMHRLMRPPAAPPARPS